MSRTRIILEPGTIGVSTCSGRRKIVSIWCLLEMGAMNWLFSMAMRLSQVILDDSLNLDSISIMIPPLQTTP